MNTLNKLAEQSNSASPLPPLAPAPNPKGNSHGTIWKDSRYIHVTLKELLAVRPRVKAKLRARYENSNNDNLKIRVKLTAVEFDGLSTIRRVVSRRPRLKFLEWKEAEEAKRKGGHGGGSGMESEETAEVDGN